MKKRTSAASTNVQVVVRCRPQNARERAAREPVIVTTDSARSEVHVRQRFSAAVTDKVKRFTFDKVFGSLATQSELYGTVVAPVVREVMQGFNCTVFAYGQTGTGKTHTMEGDVNSDELKGIIPRAVEDIFQRLEESAGDHSVKISFMELYNEQLEDLLRERQPDKSLSSATASSSSSSSLEKSTRLKLVENSRTGVVVQNLENLLVKNADDIYKHLAVALDRRKTSATRMNKQSSRSHSVFTITIHIKETTPEGEDLLKVGKLNLVDLAGSECVGRSGASGDRKREAGNINQSLLTLGRVISALVEKRRHVPYRDSKLTRLLQESLGGRAKTTIIATVTPSAGGLEETFSTLKYANTAKSIENKPEVNQRMTKRTYVKEIHVEMERLNLALAAARNKDGVYLPTEQYAELNEKVRTSQAAQKEAEQALERRQAELQDAIKRFNISEADLAAVRAELVETQQELVDTTAVLDVREEKLDAVGTKGAATRDEGVKASADVAALHLKVGRKASVVSRNAASAKDLAEKLNGDLSCLTETMENAVAVRKKQDSELCASLREHATLHAERSAAIVHMIAEVERLCASAVAAAAASVDTFEASTSTASTNTHDALKQGLDALKKSITLQADGAASVFASQQQSLVAHQQAFVTFIENDVHTAVATLQKDIVGAAAASEQALLAKAKANATADTNKHTEGMGVLRENTQSSLHKADESYQQVNKDNVQALGQDLENASNEVGHQTERLEAKLRAHAEASASGLAAMRKQMESMMQEFAKAQDTQLAEVVAQLCSDKEKAQSGLANVATMHSVRADAERAQIAESIVTPMNLAAAALETRATEGMLTMCESFAATTSAAEDTWSQTNTAVTAWGEGVMMSTDKFIDASATAHKESVAQVAGASAALVTYKEEQLSALDTMVSAAAASQRSATSALATHSSTVKAQLDDGILKPIASELSIPGRTALDAWTAAAVTNAQETVASIETAMHGAESEMSARVAAVKGVSSTINTFVGELAVDVPTGATPMKRVYEFPSPFGKMTPRAKVLTRHRGEDDVTEAAPASAELGKGSERGEEESDGEDGSRSSNPEEQGVTTEPASEAEDPQAPQAAAETLPIPLMVDEAVPSNDAEPEKEEENDNVSRSKTRSTISLRASKIPQPTKARKKKRIVRKKTAAKSSVRRSARNTPAKALRELN